MFKEEPREVFAYTQAELNETIQTISHFLALLIFRGCIGSSSPSQCTSYSVFRFPLKSSSCLSSSPKYLKPYPSPYVRELFGTLPSFRLRLKPRPVGSRAASPLALDSWFADESVSGAYCSGGSSDVFPMLGRLREEFMEFLKVESESL